MGDLSFEVQAWSFGLDEVPAHRRWLKKIDTELMVRESDLGLGLKVLGFGVWVCGLSKRSARCCTQLHESARGVGDGKIALHVWFFFNRAEKGLDATWIWWAQERWERERERERESEEREERERDSETGREREERKKKIWRRETAFFSLWPSKEQDVLSSWQAPLLVFIF